MLDHDEALAMAERDAARTREGYVPMGIDMTRPDGFLATWVTDGLSVQGNGRSTPRVPEPEPVVEPLLELLDDLGLRRRQVNEVLALFERGTHREVDGHDGSWSEIAFKHLPVATLMDRLVAMGAVESHRRP